MNISPNSDTITGNISTLAVDVVSLDILMSIDQVFDDLGLYTYANWHDGELVEGPVIGRYWVESTWMWPRKKMPDPDGAMRLYKKGAEVEFSKEMFLKTVRITGPESFDDTATKSVKQSEHEVWCVKIKLPRRMVDDNIFDVIDPEKIILDQEMGEDIYGDTDAGDEADAGDEI